MSQQPARPFLSGSAFLPWRPLAALRRDWNTLPMQARLLSLALVLTLLLSGGEAVAIADQRPEQGSFLYLPLVVTGEAGCEPLPNESYAAISVLSPSPDPPAEEHADLNLALRGYASTSATLGLVSYNGGADSQAPQLYALFEDQRVPSFAAVHQVHDWDWSCNCRGPLLSWPPVTLAEFVVDPGEPLRVPDSGYTIGQPAYEALVLYASPERITLHYTREDSVVHGYTVHIEGVCVEPRLLDLYRQWNAAGRSYLPALRGNQAFGRARAQTIGVAIRDTGTFMDPRSRKDWWQGK